MSERSEEFPMRGLETGLLADLDLFDESNADLHNLLGDIATDPENVPPSLHEDIIAELVDESASGIMALAESLPEAYGNLGAAKDHLAVLWNQADGKRINLFAGLVHLEEDEGCECLVSYTEPQARQKVEEIFRADSTAERLEQVYSTYKSHLWHDVERLLHHVADSHPESY